MNENELGNLRNSFEQALMNKLSQNTTKEISEKKVLMNAFKYFDLHDDGRVEMNEFAKAIEKLGIMIPTLKDCKVIFSVYESGGTIGYR